MATANASDQILLDLLGREGYNEWFTVDLPGDENSLSAAALSLSKDSLKKENDKVCESATLSLEDFQNYFMALFQDEAVIQDIADSGKALTVSTGISSEGVHGKFAETKTKKFLKLGSPLFQPKLAKIRPTAYECGMNGHHLEMEDQELRLPMFHFRFS